MRAALKQDCDVVMISSVEDTEVAQVAAAAAARGVLVLAGIEDAEIFPAPDLFIQTALVRRLGGKQIADKHKLTRAQADGLEEFADFANVLSALKEEGKVDPRDRAVLDSVSDEFCVNCYDRNKILIDDLAGSTE